MKQAYDFNFKKHLTHATAAHPLILVVLPVLALYFNKPIGFLVVSHQIIRSIRFGICRIVLTSIFRTNLYTDPSVASRQAWQESLALTKNVADVPKGS